MVQKANQKTGASFVLRLWREADSGGSPEWRWQVHHVQTGQQRYFRRLVDVLEFVGERSDAPPPGVSLPGEPG